MSEQNVQARSDKRKLRWTSWGIGVLTLGSGLACQSLLRHHPVELRASASILAPLGVFFLSWTFAWLCGIRPFGG
jgi:hypothetical protein